MITNKIRNDAFLILSFDDASPENIKLAKFLKQEGLKATFFIPTGLTGENFDEIKALHELGFDIGGHSVTHPSDLKQLPIEEALTEIQLCKNQIEKLTKKPCISFAYPRGRFNEQTIMLVKKAGYKEARTTHVLHTNYSLDHYRIPTTVHVYDGRKEYQGRHWYDMAQFYFEHVLKRGGTFHLWGHAHEIERDGQWNNFERFIWRIKKMVKASGGSVG